MRVKQRFLSPRTLQKARNGIVVFGGNRIELVVVTACASESDAEERLAHHVDLVVDASCLIALDIDGSVSGFAQKPKACSNDGFVETRIWVKPRGGQQVARQMLPNELIVGNVRVEGPDQIIAILMCTRNGIVELMSAGFRIPNEVHPVTRPTFTKVG